MLAIQNRRIRQFFRTEALFFLASVFLSQHAVAAEKETDLYYSVYLGGLYLGSIETEVRQGEGSYKIESAANTNEAFNWVINWFARGETEGFVDLGKFFPRQHQHKSAWNKNVRTVTLDYAKSGEVRVQKTSTRPEPEKKYTSIDPDSLVNSIDPMTAILTMSNRLDRGEGCDAQLPVFDGHRRYDVQLTEKPAKYFKSSRYSVFEGRAVGCKIEIVKKGGFPVDQDHQRNADQELVIWAGSPIDGGHIVPVRMQVETQFGAMELHLDRYREGSQELASHNAQ